MVQVPQNIYNTVNPTANSYGIPPIIWEDIAYVESGFNPNAVGDSGSSFGLFQLHIGGQADSAINQGYTTQQLLDPAINAKFALPSIASAWNNLKASFNPGSASWWQSFAAQSGHPGGTPGQTVTNNEASILQSDYNLFGGTALPFQPIAPIVFPGSGSSTGTPFTGVTSTPYNAQYSCTPQPYKTQNCNLGDWQCYAQNIAGSTLSPITNFINQINCVDFKSVATRVVMLIFALVLIVTAFKQFSGGGVSQPQNSSYQAPVGNVGKAEGTASKADVEEVVAA